MFTKKQVEDTKQTLNDIRILLKNDPAFRDMDVTISISQVPCVGGGGVDIVTGTIMFKLKK